ncbi:MAG: WbqC family protein [Proteobacteria bacterium]|nr:WbqC family protein [Pseudomonadota bacterium]
MKLGIMQPYFFPYIGYFQLIDTVDQFVIHDDVQWIKGGWINRNRILVQGASRYITLPVKKDSTLFDINQLILPPDISKHKQKIIRQIENAYRKAPHFASVMQLVSDCFAYQERNVSKFIVNSLLTCCDHLGIQTPFVLSSTLDKKNELHAQDRVLNINMVMKASHYINPIGGTELYNKARFVENGLQLSFLKSNDVAYNQFCDHEFIPNLSIIDVMMFNSKWKIADMLKAYDLL